MKKLISLLLALVMLVSLAVPAFAETDPKTGEEYELFGNFWFGTSGSNAKVETDNFILESNWHTDKYVEGGGGNAFVSIKAKENSGLIIKRIEARVANYEDDYGGVGVTAGEKYETGNVGYKAIVHVNNINSREFAFAGGSKYVLFDMIKVYYEEASGAPGFTISEGNGWIIAGAVAVAVVAVAAVVIAKKKKKA